MTWRLVSVPAVISFGFTIVRLIGEIAGTSVTWFSVWHAVPGNWMSSVIGITWLALPFGAYFGWVLARRGEGPRSRIGAVLVALVLVALMYGGLPLLWPRLDHLTFAGLTWGLLVFGAAAQSLAWPALARTLAAYGLFAHLTVAVVMLLAMDRRWGTHYDLQGMASLLDLERALMLSLGRQLLTCLPSTILTGGVAGALAALAAGPGGNP